MKRLLVRSLEKSCVPAVSCTKTDGVVCVICFGALRSSDDTSEEELLLDLGDEEVSRNN